LFHLSRLFDWQFCYDSQAEGVRSVLAVVGEHPAVAVPVLSEVNAMRAPPTRDVFR